MIQGKDMLFSYVISVIENRDFYAEYHCEKVQRFTRILLEKVIRFCPDYKISEEDVDTICFAAMLHDVGKIVVPDRILHKAGRLDFNELEIMKNHTRKGRQIFERLMKLTREDSADYALYKCCAEVCMYHHERYDGDGYPLGLKGDEIPIAAQVVSVADVYDALTSERVYKKAFSHEKAMEMILAGECGTFNPLLLECLQDIQGNIQVEMKRAAEQPMLVQNSYVGKMIETVQ